MLGRMQEWPLLMHKIIDFAAIQFPTREVASRMVEGPMHRTNYREIRERALKVAKRLDRDGIKLGDRVATLAWNGFRHLEAWYGITGPRRHLSHRQSAPVPRADRLDRQPRRGPDRDDRPHLRAAPRGDRRPSADGRALRRPDRRRAHAGDQAQERRRLRGLDRRGRRAISAGRSSTSAPPPASATPPAPPATRRACSIRIARTSCIR